MARRAPPRRPGVQLTIRAKLYAAILLAVLGPLVTIAVALDGEARLGERFDEVRERARHEGLARQLKFGVTDVNGWQTAYGYDDGASRPRFERSVAASGPTSAGRGASSPTRPSAACSASSMLVSIAS